MVDARRRWVGIGLTRVAVDLTSTQRQPSGNPGHIRGALLHNIPKFGPCEHIKGALLAPAGILREPFYKIFQFVGPCGHIKGALLQNSQNSRRVGRVGRVVSRRVASCRVGRRVFILHFLHFFIFNLRPDTPRNMRFFFAGLPHFFNFYEKL